MTLWKVFIHFAVTNAAHHAGKMVSLWSDLALVWFSIRLETETPQYKVWTDSSQRTFFSIKNFTERKNIIDVKIQYNSRFDYSSICVVSRADSTQKLKSLLKGLKRCLYFQDTMTLKEALIIIDSITNIQSCKLLNTTKIFNGTVFIVFKWFQLSFSIKCFTIWESHFLEALLFSQKLSKIHFSNYI